MSSDTFGYVVLTLILLFIGWVFLRAAWNFIAGVREGYRRHVSQPAASTERTAEPSPAPTQTPQTPSVPSAARPSNGHPLASGVFISYRRDDSPDVAGRIYDRLVAEFGKAAVFKDVDTLPLGDDFRVHLENAVGRAAVVLAIIGPRWHGTDTASGTRRIDSGRDFVQIELSSALSRQIPVVPVLVGGATMPEESDLPGALANLAYRNAIHVRADPDFHNDVDRLVRGIHRLLERASQ